MRASAPAAVFFRLAFSPARRLLHVWMGLPAEGGCEVGLSMASWTPGSYTLREYARHVLQLQAVWLPAVSGSGCAPGLDSASGLGSVPAPGPAPAPGAAVTSSAVPLAAVKTSKNRWAVQTPAGGPGWVWVAYSLYAHEMSVRTNTCGDSFSLVVGAATFLAWEGHEGCPHVLEICPPEDYPAVYVALPEAAPPGWVASTAVGAAAHSGPALPAKALPEAMLAGSPEVEGGPLAAPTTELGTAAEGLLWGQVAAAAWPAAGPPAWPVGPVAPASWPTAGRRRLVASSYAALVDAPILAGRPRLAAFTAAGRRHQLATMVDGVAWDDRRAAGEVGRIVEAHAKVFGEVPYRGYLILNVLAGGGGGLEHANSCLLAASPFTQRSRAETVRWWGLVSHEVFHAWNVKRLIPRALAGCGLQGEAHTHSLWIAEGITAYYDDLQVCRAGLSRPDEYLGRLATSISQTLRAPGSGLQSLAESSFDAWTKFYRRDENSDNSQVSYYSKGCVVAFMLDMRLRRLTGERANLDTLMRLAWQRLAGPQGFDEADFRALADGVAGQSLAPFFAAYVDSAEPLDLGPALASVGLELLPIPAGVGDGEARPVGFLGASTRRSEAGLWVQEVVSGGPAELAGIFPGDEIVALDAYRVGPETFAARLAELAVGEAFSLLVARRGRLLRLAVALGTCRPSAWRLQVNAGADEVAHGARRRWLWGPAA